MPYLLHLHAMWLILYSTVGHRSSIGLIYRKLVQYWSYGSVRSYKWFKWPSSSTVDKKGSQTGQNIFSQSTSQNATWQKETKRMEMLFFSVLGSVFVRLAVGSRTHCSASVVMFIPNVFQWIPSKKWRLSVVPCDCDQPNCVNLYPA